MKYDEMFDTEENQALMAICTRKLIRNIGIGGIVWGLINIVLGFILLRVTIINAGILLLGMLMFGTGVQALRNPSLDVLRAEAIVSALLFLWNLGITLLNLKEAGTFEPRGLIFPLIVAATVSNYYRKLGHLRHQIESVEPARIEDTQRLCKLLLKMKLKVEPMVVETTDRKCRVQLMDGHAFFIHRDLMRAFVGKHDAIRNAVSKPETMKWSMAFKHPLGKLKYKFDKKSTEKLRHWLTGESQQADGVTVM